MFAVEHFDSKFVELITKLSICNEFFTNRWLPNIFVDMIATSDIMPGYTASHSACKETTNLRAKFYGKTALNGEIPVNKYQNNINHMS